MFWDSSALVPLLLPEPRSSEIAAILGVDQAMTLWWGSPVECQSALYRRHREAPIPGDLLDQALERLEAIYRGSDMVPATEEVRRRAGRLLRVHALRAGDALQLAACLVSCEEEPVGETFVSLDDRLREAARREGFTLLPAETGARG